MNKTRHNRPLKERFSRDVLELVKGSFESVVMSTSFGKYSAVMLHLVHAEIERVPVINIQLDTETTETGRHRAALQDMLRVDLRLYTQQPGQSKRQLFSHALRETGAKTLVSGLMWEETAHRQDFEFIMYDQDAGLYRVHPILHWRESDLAAYCRAHRLPVNQNYHDPAKEDSEKKECGIHLFGYEKDGSGI